MDQVLISFEVDPWLLLSPVPAPMQMLQAALGALAEINPADLPEDQALAMGAGLVASQDQLQALALRSVADVDTRGLHSADGYTSTRAWVADQQTSMGP